MSSRDEIRKAMDRLLTGTAQHTDGRLTRSNLAAEAGLGRATLYRHPDLLDEWAHRSSDINSDDISPSHRGAIARLTRQLADERRRRANAERINEGLAFVVAELYRQLEAKADEKSLGRVIPLNPNTIPKSCQPI